MNLIEGLNFLFLATTVFLIGYYVLLGLIAFISKKKKDFSTQKSRKFAVVLHSQDQENTLSRSLYSLSGLVYPKNKYDLFVIANNFSNKSIAEAENLGATVLTRSQGEGPGNKNMILERAFNHILQKHDHYDALIVFSSDCLVSGNYLEVMNSYLENGSEVIQSSHQILPQKRNWTQKILKIEFLINNKIKPLGRRFLGLSMQVRDTGICFSVPLLREITWDIHEQKNIIDYGLNLQLQGIEIDFAPEAVFFSDLDDQQIAPTEVGFSEKFKIVIKTVSSLFEKYPKRMPLRHLDRLIDLLLPKLSTVVTFVGIAILLNGIGWSFGFIPVIYIIMWFEIAIAGWLCVFMLLSVLDEKKKLIKSILYLPIVFFITVRPLVEIFSNSDSKKNSRKDGLDPDPVVFSDEHHSV